MTPAADPAANDPIILVDADDREVGTMPKLAAHRDGGHLHRAFSIFIFDPAGRMLLQRRARTKYHFGGLWTNACCSHPLPGQPLPDIAHARLREEMGLDAPLAKLFTFTYRAHDPASGLTEHELDHVYAGTTADQPQPNPAEVDEWRWVAVAELLADVAASPDAYTPWFKAALADVLRAVGRGGFAAANTARGDAPRTSPRGSIAVQGREDSPPAQGHPQGPDREDEREH